MDVVLEFCDRHFFTPYVYPDWWKESDIWRQFITLNIVTDLGGVILYFMTAGLNYAFVFDKRLMKHPQILPNQIQREISVTLNSIPWMGLLTATLFLAEVRNYSQLYDSKDFPDVGWSNHLVTLIGFIMFTDCLIYWIHRGLHHRLVYKHLHKTHHMWKVPTPFASHAFHPLDGFLQSLPYHFFIFLFPMNKFMYLIMYVLVNVWTVSIHDGDFRVPAPLRPFINGSAHHTDHHLLYNYNYGQYTTLWDRLGGSFRHPQAFQGSGPIEEVLKRERDQTGKRD